MIQFQGVHQQHVFLLAMQVAACLEEQGRLQEAANQLEALCLVVPRDAGLLCSLASLHARLGSQGDALR